MNGGSLDKYEHSDLTPVIGREFNGVQVKDFLDGDEQLIKDLAVSSKWGASAPRRTSLTYA